LNNVGKGIARDEPAYYMNMLNTYVRAELHEIMNWYIGAQHGFELSTGKNGRFFKRYLPPDLYKRYLATYSGAGNNEIWESIYAMCDLFHDLALPVAEKFGFTYKQDEEDGIREYLRLVRNDNKTHV